MLEVNNVTKTYVSKKRVTLFTNEKIVKTAVEDVSLVVPRGKIIGILGENGAGKTTLIKMMSTLLIPDKGEIKIDGKDIQDNLKLSRGNINIISGGEKNLYWRLTGMENLEYFATLYSIPKHIATPRILSLLKEVGLEEYKDDPVEQYSKGMKQRLQIAKGLINEPKYLFLDEPTLGLDVSIALEMRQKIKEIAKKYNTGILLTTHYMAEAEELCDYLYILHKGRVVLSGTKSDVFLALNLKNELIITLEPSFKFQRSKYRDKSFLFKSIEYNEEENIIKIQVSLETELASCIDELISCGIRFQQIEFTKPRLEDVILSL
ncbi:MAG: ABC transporter ATP-binding protein [Streptococcus sp.]|nr:MAG: ABC transporter ATP-binding protein [Streptococcus sp.]